MGSTRRPKANPHQEPEPALWVAQLRRKGTDYLVISVPAEGRDSRTTPFGQSPPAGRLTAAERDVIRGLLRGYSNAEIARLRGTSRRTVTTQVGNLYRKLGVSSRGELIARWYAARGALTR